MQSFLVALKYPVLLVSALSVDSFGAAFAYGSGKIRISLLSSAVISGICSLILGASLLLGGWVLPVVPRGFAQGLCFLILFLLGLAKLFDSSVKALIRKKQRIRRHIRFSVSSLHFILSIYADPREADRDLSQTISLSEAAALAAALSLDGAAAGLGAGLVGAPPVLTLLLSFVWGMAAVGLGCALGERVARRSSRDFSWVSGLLLLLLAFCKLS